MDLSKNGRQIACCASVKCCRRGNGIGNIKLSHLGVMTGASCGIGQVLGFKISLFIGHHGGGACLASACKLIGPMCCSHGTGPCCRPFSTGKGCMCSFSIRGGSSASLKFGVFRRHGGASGRRAVGTLSSVFSTRLHFGSGLGFAARLNLRLSGTSGRRVTSGRDFSVHVVHGGDGC